MNPNNVKGPTQQQRQLEQNQPEQVTKDASVAVSINSQNSDSSNEIEGIRFVDYVDESQLEHVMSLVGRDLSEPYSIFTYRYFLHRFPHLCIFAVPTDSDMPIGCVVGKIDYENQQQNSSCNQNETFQENYDEDYDDIDVNESTTTSDHSGNQHLTHNESSSVVRNVNNNNQEINVQNNRQHRQRSTVGYIGMLAVSKEYRRKGIGKALVSKILYRMKYRYNCSSVTLETEVTNVSAQSLYQDIFGFIREELLVRYYLNWNDAYRLRLWL